MEESKKRTINRIVETINTLAAITYVVNGIFHLSETVATVTLYIWMACVIYLLTQWKENKRFNNILNVVLLILMIGVLFFRW